MVDRLALIGVHVHKVTPDADDACCTVRVTSERMLKPTVITTQPHPGFPTDLQAQFMALLCSANGNSVITEKIYPERFMHVAELARMGAQLLRHGPTVVVSGGSRLVGAEVMASDLRASASLVIAGLAADGETTINRVYHLSAVTSAWKRCCDSSARRSSGSARGQRKCQTREERACERACRIPCKRRADATATLRLGITRLNETAGRAHRNRTDGIAHRARLA